MNIARVSEGGRITVPFEVMQMLGLKFGDRVAFEQNANGEIVFSNVSAHAIRKAQAAFEGAADLLGVRNDADVQALVDEVRYCR